MLCPNCRSEIDASAKVCTKCGCAVEARLCPNGHVMDTSWTTCLYCSPPAARWQKGRTVVESGAAPAGGGSFVRGATLLDGERAPLPGKGGTIVESGGAAGKHRTVFDPGSAPSAASASGRALPRLVGWLVTFSHAPSGDDYRLREGRNVIGADSRDCDVAINNDSGMSAKHAVIMVRDGRFLIRDNDSTNGTYVNDIDIFGKESLELHPGDRVRVGGTEFVVHRLLP